MLWHSSLVWKTRRPGLLLKFPPAAALQTDNADDLLNSCRTRMYTDIGNEEQTNALLAHSNTKAAERTLSILL